MTLPLQCLTSQNGQIQFKNVATNTATFLKVSDQFGTLCINRLKSSSVERILLTSILDRKALEF